MQPTTVLCPYRNCTGSATGPCVPALCVLLLLAGACGGPAAGSVLPTLPVISRVPATTSTTTCYLVNFPKHLGTGYSKNICMTSKGRGRGRGRTRTRSKGKGTLRCAQSPTCFGPGCTGGPRSGKGEAPGQPPAAKLGKEQSLDAQDSE